MQGFYRVGRAGQGRAGVRRHGVINFYCHLVLVQQNLSILHSSDRALTNIYGTEGKRKLEYNIFFGKLFNIIYSRANFEV